MIATYVTEYLELFKKRLKSHWVVLYFWGCHMGKLSLSHTDLCTHLLYSKLLRRLI